MVLEILELVNQVFESFFFGGGMLLGLLLYIILALSMFLKWKLSGVLIFPLCIFMALEYTIRLNQNPGEIKYYWGMIIMFLTAIFISVMGVKGDK